MCVTASQSLCSWSLFTEPTVLLQQRVLIFLLSDRSDLRPYRCLLKTPGPLNRKRCVESPDNSKCPASNPVANIQLTWAESNFSSFCELNLPIAHFLCQYSSFVHFTIFMLKKIFSVLSWIVFLAEWSGRCKTAIMRHRNSSLKWDIIIVMMMNTFTRTCVESD